MQPRNCPRPRSVTHRSLMMLRRNDCDSDQLSFHTPTREEPLTTWNNDNQQQYDYANNDPDPHLHVLPPHLLADTIGAATEALSGLIEVLRFVLELVNVLAALGDGFEVLLHHVDGVIDLLDTRVC